MSRLRFIEKTHEYFLDGKPIPSVTTILHDVGLYPSFDYVEDYYRDRGTLAHLACHYDDLGTLDEKKLDEKLRGYIESYRKFKKKTKFVVEESETKLFNEVLWYAGTEDKFGLIRFGFSGLHRHASIDLKCGPFCGGYQYQSAAYVGCRENRYSILRFSVHLDKSGGLPTVIEHENRSDFHVFEAATTIYHLKRKVKK